MRRKKQKRKRLTSSLKDHRKVGKVLLPPLAQLTPAMTTIDWIRDQLPEFLWIDSVLAAPGAVELFNRCLDALDPFVPDGPQLLVGTVSSFRLVPADRRPEALVAVRDSGLYKAAFPDVFLTAIGLYPECPMAWVADEQWRRDHRIDPEVGLAWLREAVLRLMPGKDKTATLRRMVPVNRLFKHNRLLLNKNLEVTKYLGSYPNCSERGQHLVESFGRSCMNIHFMQEREKDPTGWAAYFWGQNFNLTVCQLPDGEAGVAVEEPALQQTLGQLSAVVRSLADLLAHRFQRVALDLYAPDRDEILNGFLSRQFRLFQAVALDPHLWSVDLSDMVIRAMADTLITLKWLAKRNDPALFEKFKRHSLGKEKLLKLHIERLLDAGGADPSLEARREALSDTLGDEVWEELLPIRLGSWTGMDTRRIATEVGLSELYNLVFAPLSTVLHGEWSALRSYNLRRCVNPLHRLHRIPVFQAPLGDPQVVDFAYGLCADAIRCWTEVYALGDCGGELEKHRRQIGEALDSLRTAPAE